MACRPRAPTASEAGAVGCECVRCSVVWMMERTHFMRKWKGKIQQAVTAQAASGVILLLLA